MLRVLIDAPRRGTSNDEYLQHVCFQEEIGKILCGYLHLIPLLCGAMVMHSNR